MGKTRDRNRPRSASTTLSSFPSPSSSSSSDFEFTVSLSPSSKRSSLLCPADELFYKGQLLPLHLSPRISMVRTLLLASSSTSSSSDTTTTASRDSNGSSSSSSFSADLLLLPECDSSRPSSVTEEDAKRVPAVPKRPGSKYFSSFAARFSSVFLNRGSSKKDSSSSPAAIDLNFQIPNKRTNSSSSSSSSTSAKQVIKKYVKKVKSSLQNKQSQQPSQQQYQQKKTFSFSIRRETDASTNYIAGSIKKDEDRGGNEPTGGVYAHSQSFSGNLRYPRRRRCAGSCPSSMRSSPTHSGLLCVSGGGGVGGGGIPAPETSISSSSSVSSSMEELQSAIQGAIAHCKSTMIPSTQKIRSPLANDY